MLNTVTLTEVNLSLIILGYKNISLILDLLKNFTFFINDVSKLPNIQLLLFE